ncbi:hypothetical protein [Enhygromyxa salina]|nr:hypothetical protein [Enhygromyxa salina]
MSMPSIALLSLSLLAAPILAAGPPERDACEGAERCDSEAGEPIEIIVRTQKRPDWLFPGLDHPRVQAYFRSGSSVGGSLFDEPEAEQRRPLVRAGTISVRGADSRADRKAARRFARELVADVRPALEACYADVLARSPTDAARLTFHVELSRGERGAVQVSAGTLGDVYGNACVHGVLEFADVDAPKLEAGVDIPVWFWMQTM